MTQLPASRILRVALLISVACLLLLLAGCGDGPTPYPRPMGFPRIELPTQTRFTTFQSEPCPFEFEYPASGTISRNLKDSCWVDIHFPPYDCTWHLTYRDIPASGKPRAAHFEEFRTLVYKHIKKASQIKDASFGMEAGYGTVYEVFGNVGTPLYVFLSDSADQHLVLTTFYFQTATKNDSLAPVIDYMKAQVDHAMQTLRWKP